MQNNKQIPVIINCDTGIDDAVALMIGVKSNKLDIRLIVTDLGNVDTTQSAINTLNVLELINAPEIPVCAGDGRCYKKERKRVSVHGNDGLGGYKFGKNPRKILKGDGVEEMYKTLMSSDEKITIISLAPSSNIAKLISSHPDCKEKIERFVIMVGTIEETPEGEIPYPEFNCSGDPEACEYILNIGIPFEIVPMEMGHTAYLTWQEVFKTKNTNFVGEALEFIYRSYRDRHVKNGIATHDGCAIAYVTNPELFKTKPVNAEVVYYDSIGTGVMTMDFNKDSNAITCFEMDIPKFKKLYFSTLKQCKRKGF
ncbi:MAG: nucleoside hydrolase [Clostridia bacterium]|nr:nucleoside hydrolase [Clostridia bacterium]